MAEFDQAGFDDADDAFSEIDTAFDEHVRQTSYRAVSTRRGMDLEEPSRWVDLRGLLEQKVRPRLAGAASTAGGDLQDTDSRVRRAVYRIIPDQLLKWTAEITTTAGVLTVAGPLATLPQDVPAEDPALAPDPNAVPVRGMRTLRQFILDTSHTPSWLVGPNMGRALWATGLVLDLAIEWLYQGIQQRFPDTCEAGALPWLARDRRLRRGLRESEAGFRERLKGWLAAHRRAGSPFAVLSQEQAYFSPQRPIVRTVEHDPTGATRATWVTLYADGTEEVVRVSPSNWDWDSADPLYTQTNMRVRFWLIVYQDPTDTASIFQVDQDSDAADAPDTTWATTASVESALDLSRLADDWKSEGTWFGGSIVAFDLTAFAPTGSGAGYPDGTWYRYADPVTREPTRNLGAQYFDYRRRPETVG